MPGCALTGPELAMSAPMEVSEGSKYPNMGSVAPVCKES